MLSELQCLVQLEGLAKLKRIIHLIGSRTRNLPACSIVPHPLRYQVTGWEAMTYGIRICNLSILYFLFNIRNYVYSCTPVILKHFTAVLSTVMLKQVDYPHWLIVKNNQKDSVLPQCEKLHRHSPREAQSQRTKANVICESLFPLQMFSFVLYEYYVTYCTYQGWDRRYRSCFRSSAIRQKVSDSIHGNVIIFSNWPNHSNSTI
jgi:hypothetical protein